MDLKTDDNGWQFATALPANFRLATIEDFHKNGRKKIGMEYFIKRIIEEDYYEFYRVHEKLTAAYLMPFIENKGVFIAEDHE